MKKKILSNTYLNEALKYQIKFYLDEEDKYIIVKKLIKLSKPFIIKNNVIAMNDGYYVIEFIPKNKNYALRLFLNDKKEVIEYYFDIIKESGIDKELKIPYFVDLYLDITIQKNSEINILDEEELNNALKNKDITKEDYKLVIKVKEQLLKEIKEKQNDLINLDYMKYLTDL